LQDSEDSQQSSDAKTGKGRIPRKKKEEKGEVPSPGEEMPLIPKGFMEQKKRLEEEKKTVEEKLSTVGEVVKSIRVMDADEKKEIEAKLKSFRKINENHYMCTRKVNKQSKKMQCDCTLTKRRRWPMEKRVVETIVSTGCSLLSVERFVNWTRCVAIRGSRPWKMHP